MEFYNKHVLSRRRFLVAGSALGLALTGCNNKTVSCSDPARLSDEELSLRASLNYIEGAPGTEVCADCSFFRVAAGSGCGTCELLKGPVNPKGRCDSWSKREPNKNDRDRIATEISTRSP